MFKSKEEERARSRRLEILDELRSWGQTVHVNSGRVIRKQLVQLEEMECIRNGAYMLVMSGVTEVVVAHKGGLRRGRVWHTGTERRELSRIHVHGHI